MQELLEDVYSAYRCNEKKLRPTIQPFVQNKLIKEGICAYSPDFHVRHFIPAHRTPEQAQELVYTLVATHIDCLSTVPGRYIKI